MDATELLLWGMSAIFLVALLYKYFTKIYDFWAKQNVPFVKPKFFIGNFQWKKPLHVVEKELYQKLGRIYGRFDGRSPVLTVAEPELVKKILQKEFNIFPNHRDLKCNDPIMDNSLFVLEDHDWKRVRTIVSPTFTPAKLKKMIPILEESATDVLDKFEKSISENDDVLCQSVFGHFAVAAIGKCAFGIKLNSSEEEILVHKAKDLLVCNCSWRTVCIMLFPKLMKLFKISLLNPKTLNYYKSLIVDVVCFRKENSHSRKDFLQQMMNAERKISDKNNNEVEKCLVSPAASPTFCNQNTQPLCKGLSQEESMAQCVSFIMAGFDPTTSLLSHIAYHLARRQDIQQRLYDEITESMDTAHGVINFEALSELKFMDAVIDEALRLCPPLVRIERRAEVNYEFEEHGIKINKGMLVSIPIYCMHRDPEWFENPDEFNPDRFLSNGFKPTPCTYLPFGDGPRICVGKRFVLLGVKILLAKFLLKFKVQAPNEEQVPLEVVEVRGTLKVSNVSVKLALR